MRSGGSGFIIYSMIEGSDDMNGNNNALHDNFRALKLGETSTEVEPTVGRSLFFQDVSKKSKKISSRLARNVILGQISLIFDTFFVRTGCWRGTPLEWIWTNRSFGIISLINTYAEVRTSRSTNFEPSESGVSYVETPKILTSNAKLDLRSSQMRMTL